MMKNAWKTGMDAHEFMEMALAEAENAGREGEVPVGAVLVDGAGVVIARAHNQVITLHDPTAHAEILAIRKAGQTCQNYRLLNTTLYVTIEPCVMCMGAIIHARIEKVVFGAFDPKWGGAGSLYRMDQDIRLNHRPQVVAGVCESRCRQMLVDFFKAKR